MNSEIKNTLKLSLILAFMSASVYAAGFADETQGDARDVAATTAALQDMRVTGAGAGAGATAAATATEATRLATAPHASVNIAAIELLAPADERMSLAEFYAANLREDIARMNTCTHIVIDGFAPDMTDQYNLLKRLLDAIPARPDLTTVIDFGDEGRIPDCLGFEYNEYLNRQARYFISCHKITVVGRNLIMIGDSFLFGCRSLTHVTLPDSITTIGYAFLEGCCSLTQLTLPNGITMIDGRFLYGCSSLGAGSVVFNGIECMDVVRGLLLNSTCPHNQDLARRNFDENGNPTADSIFAFVGGCYI